jgi:hypothetical protein
MLYNVGVTNSCFTRKVFLYHLPQSSFNVVSIPCSSELSYKVGVAIWYLFLRVALQGRCFYTICITAPLHGRCYFTVFPQQLYKLGRCSIRIRPTKVNADPCGSGSATMVLPYHNCVSHYCTYAIL